MSQVNPGNGGELPRLTAAARVFLPLGGNRQLTVQSGVSFGRHDITPSNVCRNRQRPHGSMSFCSLSDQLPGPGDSATAGTIGSAR